MIASLSVSVVGLALARLITALDLPVYTNLRTSQEREGILEVTFHNPISDINLWGTPMQEEMIDLVQRLQNDNSTKVVIFKSDRPEYFLAHADLTSGTLDGNGATRGAELLHNMTNLQQVTIGSVNGIARGGGNEFLVSIDMRFAAKPLAKFGQLEVALGIIPGLGGTQYLSRLIGRGLAMEYILSSNDINAEEAERISWINKAFETPEDMDFYVNNLAARFAVFPLEAMGAAKQSINTATRPKLEDTVADAATFSRLLKSPSVQALVSAPAASSNQSAVDSERFLGDNLPYIYPAFIAPDRTVSLNGTTKSSSRCK